MEDTTNYYNQLIQLYSNPNVPVPGTVEATEKLIQFNGYYALKNQAGAFFAIDTNMIVSSGRNPQYNLCLLISLDGKTSSRHPFTGSFDGKHLVQLDKENGLSIELTFTRIPEEFGPTVTCTGSITLSGKTVNSVTGSTYNNPIPAELFKGDYLNSSTTTHHKVMSIGDNNTLLYDGGVDGALLQPITDYYYNLNMYYFSFNQDNNTIVKLIMGTASSNGFACNNMIVTTINGNPPLVNSRSLLTIPDGYSPTEDIPYIDFPKFSNNLPNLSGYYQIPQPNAPLAFLSIQAQYMTISEQLDWDLQFVRISYSMDGTHSTSYYMNQFEGMSFDDTTNTLTVSSSSGQAPLKLTFTRNYNSETGSLVNVTGNIDGVTINGSTLFNPVPLSSFGGVPLTNNSWDTLTINNDNSVTLNGTVYNSLIYVPLMYIVAAPIQNTNLVLSLGTDGLRGNACIVTSAFFDPKTSNPTSKITSVYAINCPEE